MGKYLEDAKILYTEALRELERWEQLQEPTILRDAAEKAWGAVTQAANELLDSYGQKVPSGTGARRSVLHTLERQDRQLRSLRVEARFSDAENVLHKECFYDGTCPLPLVPEKVAQDVKEFLDDVEQVTQRRQR